MTEAQSFAAAQALSGLDGSRPSSPEEPVEVPAADPPAVPIDMFSGKDGQAWDDHSLWIPSHLLPKGTKSVTTTIGGGSDCLGWAYTALTYKQP